MKENQKNATCDHRVGLGNARILTNELYMDDNMDETCTFLGERS